MSTTTLKKERIEYFDLLKGIAIFMVVMGHALTMCVRGLDAAFLFKFIGQVHMPVFFFISGYLTYKAGFATPGLKKRFVQLIIPFLVITPLWVWYFPHSHLQSPLSDNLPDLYRAYWKDGYWFTLCLFELCALYIPLSAILQRLKKTVAQVAVLLLVYGALIALSLTFADEEANIDYAGFGLLARFFPVFMMGVMANRLKDAFQRLVHSHWAVAIAMAVFAVAFYSIVYPWDVWGNDLVHLWAPIGFVTTPLMHFALIVVAIAMIEPWSHREYRTPGQKPSAIARYFNYLGHESLGIYLLHYFFLFPLTMLQEPLKEMGMATVPLAVLAAVVAFCVIAVTLLVVYALKRSKVTALL
ncbi:MAG: acyltransferase, partial [Bacteroidales bacterium]|nr:acyltransferase [Bacteroidales bacterium]